MRDLVFFVSCLSLSFITCMGQESDIFDVELMEVRIEFAQSGWEDTLRLQKLNNRKEGLLARVSIGDTVYDSVQVRHKGNSSFHGAIRAGLKKLPFRLKTAKGREFSGGYRSLKLSNNYRDPSQVRELLGYQIVGTYMPVPKVRPAILYINGEYIGVYTITEGIERPMLRRYFQSEQGCLIKCEPDFKAPRPSGCPEGSFASLEYLGEEAECYKHLYEMEDGERWESLITLTLVLRDRPHHVQNYINVDQVLWMHALNNVMVNLDSYLGIFCHNYYMYQDTNGIFHPLIWDLNLTFGGFHSLKRGVRVDLETLSPIVHRRESLEDRPLITQLLQIEDYRHQYYQMMATIVHDWFINGKYIKVAKEIQDHIRPWVQQEKDPEFSFQDFERSIHQSVKRGNTRTIPGIAELMEARTQYLSSHPLLKRASPELMTN